MDHYKIDTFRTNSALKIDFTKGFVNWNLYPRSMPNVAEVENANAVSIYMKFDLIFPTFSSILMQDTHQNGVFEVVNPIYDIFCIQNFILQKS